jgi:hypothetical protein
MGHFTFISSSYTKNRAKILFSKKLQVPKNQLQEIENPKIDFP